MNLDGLIVGLGNPGKEYENTRHNLGFMLADALLDEVRRTAPHAVTSLGTGKKKYDLWKCAPLTGGSSWLVAKPLTFMNRSGDAVAHICGFYRIPPEKILVLHDELDLPLGRMKFKTAGGLAGHNGLKSIAERTGSKDFHRLRLGIGKPQSGQTTGYVLGRFGKDEQALVEKVLQAGVEGIRIFAQQGAVAATQFINAQDIQ
ncbi:peptidyl-tRNA hydrolase [Oleidesulfovibrio alaskensis G20]|jgi:PTH1 family peptidyl-tRNA hydrolase|uniref:Peptidyl-tRNA hydrolase n=1 Tax=Oleidesulfovibrio alaskensis (strain ATCC BAA-1058 / DSM 17464 / G20) TaxID=207559 RepID=PTH_OLEA2|nr:aminoacyl-tRNA hydrolase [Oleidesulfovibrio alaskensis]Q30ZH1.1 RecName: Full=Peptidyl-tRNA hydrolase; Short=PTH [Oleidesulfovibrio alaskensis G20]ABB38925.1 peptidyl-tRNA hydrolase [Oleidesulfovibrio alaskensis G20]MBG0772286.1 aminoacyl-tRNA hydrolase [Oleidesulfovibrio alaskensis]